MTFDDVRHVALQFPGVVDSTSFGTAALRVGRRLLVRHRPEIDAVVVRIDPLDKELLIERNGDVYFTTPHYDGYPALLARLGALRPQELATLLDASYRFATARRRRRR